MGYIWYEERVREAGRRRFSAFFVDITSEVLKKKGLEKKEAQPGYKGYIERFGANTVCRSE